MLNVMKQNMWCKIFNLHKYEIIEKNILTDRDREIGQVIISRCTNCGKITYKKIYTEEGYVDDNRY